MRPAALALAAIAYALPLLAWRRVRARNERAPTA